MAITRIEILFVLLVRLTSSVIGQLVVAPSFFFLCQYHQDGNSPDSLPRTSAAVAISVQGDPDFYVPGHTYTVDVRSSLDFDGFMMIGLFAEPSSGPAQNALSLPLSLGSRSGGGGRSVCSIVQPPLTRGKPSRSLKFLWMAPPPGTGCVNFLATATLGQNVLFKDTLALQLCPEGRDDSEATRFSNLHDYPGLVVRDDFEGSEAPNPDIWASAEGGTISEERGHLASGRAIYFCSENSSLISTAWNTTSATTLEYVIGRGGNGTNDDDVVVEIVLHYARDCATWNLLTTNEIGREGVVEVVRLPLLARGQEVCFKWSPANRTSDSCWALDNVFVANSESLPDQLVEDFDPVDPANFLFFSGHVRRKCGSNGGALTFGQRRVKGHEYLVTRDLDIPADYQTDDVILIESFDSPINKDWLVIGGSVSYCPLGNGSLVMNATSGRREFCTPYLDAREARNLRFKIQIGDCVLGNNTDDFGDQLELDIESQTLNGKTTFLTKFYHDNYRFKSSSIIIGARSRERDTRFCFREVSANWNNLVGRPSWSVDDLLILPWSPSESPLLLQVKVNSRCGTRTSSSNAGDFKILVEFSRDWGSQWRLLHSLCLPPTCRGQHSAQSSIILAAQPKGWIRYSYILPYVARGFGVRFRVRSSGSSGKTPWAVDELFIGRCPRGCWGHGTCRKNADCLCDSGYSGSNCEIKDGPVITSISEDFNQDLSVSSPITALGSVVGFDCGILSRDKALVFNGDGHRQVTTSEMDCKDVKYLQFQLHRGYPSSSRRNSCPASDDPSEIVHVHYSRDGQLTWTRLTGITEPSSREPSLITIELPLAARRWPCSFKIWQANHSGLGRDVWAIDDLMLSPQLPDLVSEDFNGVPGNASLNYKNALVRTYCQSQNRSLLLRGLSSALVLGPIMVNQKSSLQFDLVIGSSCEHSKTAPIQRDLSIHLEYSLDSGNTWSLVYRPCVLGHEPIVSKYSGTRSKPGKTCYRGQSISGTVYYATDFVKWRRVTLPLPEILVASRGVKFRFRPSYHSSSDADPVWALDNVYSGPSCPDFCSGHGRCVDRAKCLCDDGFYGDTCLPPSKLDKKLLKAKMLSKRDLKEEGFDVKGALVAPPPLTACVTKAISDSPVYFNQDDIRWLSTPEVDTSLSRFVQFFAQIGGEDCVNATGPDEAVFLEYSLDGGNAYHLLKEMVPEEHRRMRLIFVPLPSESNSARTKLRWWQPNHSGLNRDQWTLDGLYLDTGESGADSSTGTELPGLLTVATHFKISHFCGLDDSLIVRGDSDRFVVTRPLNWIQGHAIFFKISVGCSSSYDPKHDVHLEYSKDDGRTWRALSVNPEPQSDKYVFRSGIDGNWTRVSIPAQAEGQLQGRITLRLIQYSDRVEYSKTGIRPLTFALKNLYFGPRCDRDCSGRGDCTRLGCRCDPGFEEVESCAMRGSNGHQLPLSWLETFDGSADSRWRYVVGGTRSTGCGVLASGNSLYFTGNAPREAVTEDFNTTNVDYLHFVVQLGGGVRGQTGCQVAKNRSDNVLVDYSLNYGLSWSRLLELDYSGLSGVPSSIAIPLPPEARSQAVSFKWRQIPTTGDEYLAQWALDNVLLGESKEIASSFRDDFNSGLNYQDGLIWYRLVGGRIDSGCHQRDKALVFDSEYHQGDNPLVETWDLKPRPGSFLQFDINLSCGRSRDSRQSSEQSRSVLLEYSWDRGKTWKGAVPDCWPPDCPVTYEPYPNAQMTEGRYSSWTRLTVYLTQDITSLSLVRFRWSSLRGPSPSIWALDNVYLGDDCVWMCSGHGRCVNSTCLCDVGYGGKSCVSVQPRPKVLRDSFDFDDENGTSIWSEISGGGYNLNCGILVSGSALVFYRDGPRLATTSDLDLTSASFAQFYLKYGCQEETDAGAEVPRVYFQFSNNGGISWHLIKEIVAASKWTHYHYYDLKDVKDLKTNSTRLRFIQNSANDASVEWAIDDLVIWADEQVPAFLWDPLTDQPNPKFWLNWPGSKAGGTLRRFDVVENGLVFETPEGSRSLTTVDLNLNSDAKIQFDILIGRDTDADSERPIRLDYSMDGGRTWSLVVGNCLTMESDEDGSTCSLEPSVYSSGSGVPEQLRRVRVPLAHFRLCGLVRFRWSQGPVTLKDGPPSWLLKNVFVGSGECPHCPVFESESRILPLLKDEFEGPEIDAKLWSRWNGAEISASCGVLATGSSLVFRFPFGERVLVSRPLDLSRASVVQFYSRLGCGVISAKKRPSGASSPVLLHYSVDTGLTWSLLDYFSYSQLWKRTSDLIALELPAEARRNGTWLRFWQPPISDNMTFGFDWALDRILIGGTLYSDLEDQLLHDDPDRESVVLVSGSTTKDGFCGESGAGETWHFVGSEDKYALTSDVTVDSSSYLQFEMALGCRQTEACYNVSLEFSADKGRSWKPVLSFCSPSQAQCRRYGQGSLYFSTTNYDKRRLYVPLMAEVTGLGMARFRWIKLASSGHRGEPWALGQFVLSSSTHCARMCSGRGQCLNRKCLCDSNWKGTICEITSVELGVSLRDGFDVMTSDLWDLNSGGVVSDLCGAMPSGRALHFYGGCSRQLVSKDWNLVNVTAIQFVLKYGCVSQPTAIRDENVLLQWSGDSGVTWTTLSEFEQSRYSTFRRISIALKRSLRLNGARLRWWQPRHSGRTASDWAIDDVIVEDTRSSTKIFDSSIDSSDTFWLLTRNAKLTSNACQDNDNDSDVLEASSTSTESALLETKDMLVRQNDALSFRIRIGCSSPKYGDVIKIEYSTNYGQDWSLIQPACSELLRHDQCESTIYSLPSVLHPEGRWLNLTLKLNENLINKTIRFRWFQEANEEAVVWFLSRVQLAPPHRETSIPIENGLMEDFNSGYLNSTYWSRAHGVLLKTLDQRNAPNLAALFRWTSEDSYGLLETVDVDLKGAKFVNFKLNIVTGSNQLNVKIYLEHSINSGLTWSILRIIATRDSGLKKIYLNLPVEVLKRDKTRLRWSWLRNSYQSSSANSPPITWSIDDVIIGGSLINPPYLYESFDSNYDPANFWFPSSGQLRNSYCDDSGFSVVFETSSESSLTTRQLIVSRAFVVQFKIRIGCGRNSSQLESRSDSDGQIILEYRTEPPEEEVGEDSWTVLFPRCLPSSIETGCQSSPFQEGSVFDRDSYGEWERITWSLPEETYSGLTQFRWRLVPSWKSTTFPSWSLSDVYVGESCPSSCRGHGDCFQGHCSCDRGYYGDDCGQTELRLPDSFEDVFDNSPTSLDNHSWKLVTGGGLVRTSQLTCGPLTRSNAMMGGSHLYFWTRGPRQVQTRPLDTSTSSKISFVLKIGGPDSNPGCHLFQHGDKSSGSVSDKAIFLQYSLDASSTWKTLATYEWSAFRDGRQVTAEVPSEAESRLGVSFRWIQAAHDGQGHDQWALDEVRLIR